MAVMRSVGSAGEAKPEEMSIGVAGNDDAVEDAGVGRVGKAEGSAMGSVSDSRFDREAVDSDRDGRVSMSPPCWSSEEPAPAPAFEVAELCGVEARGRGGGGIDSEEDESLLSRAGCSFERPSSLVRPLVRDRGGRPVLGREASMVLNVSLNKSCTAAWSIGLWSCGARDVDADEDEDEGESDSRCFRR